MSDESIIVELQHPVDVAGVSVTKLTLRAPTGQDLEDMDKAEGQIGKSFRLVASLAGIPLKTVRQMQGVDAMACVKAVNGFLEASL